MPNSDIVTGLSNRGEAPMFLFTALIALEKIRTNSRSSATSC
jgi:hypothetical protein